MPSTALTVSPPKALSKRLESPSVPALIQNAGDDALTRFLEFFAAQIRNRNTREAYARAVTQFFHWLPSNRIHTLSDIKPLHVAAWIELKTRTQAPLTVKQHLAALRHLFDWLVTGQIIPVNPAAAVRGPAHSYLKGKTPILTADEARHLLRSIPPDTVTNLRDRALIALMTYTFARVSAALAMNVKDVFPKQHRLWVRLQEKGGKYHELPCHHSLEIYLREYIDAAGIGEDKAKPLFRTINRTTKKLSTDRLQRSESLRMIQRKTKLAGIETPGIGNHTFRGTGITAYLSHPDARLELAQRMAGHADPKTTRLYSMIGAQIRSLSMKSSVSGFSCISYIANASTVVAPNHACTVFIAVFDSFCVNRTAKRLFGREQTT